MIVFDALTEDQLETSSDLAPWREARSRTARSKIVVPDQVCAWLLHDVPTFLRGAAASPRHSAYIEDPLSGL